GTGRTHTTGPKTSSSHTSRPSGTPASTIGPRRPSGRAPSTTSRAPRPTASSTQRRTRSVARAPHSGASRGDPPRGAPPRRAPPHRVVDPAAYPFGGSGVDQRRDPGGLLAGIADRDRRHAVGEQPEKLVGDGRLDEHPLHGDTGLAGGVVPAAHHRVGRGRQ